MAFIRAKTIKNQIYYYLVKSQRIGNKVKQIHLRYLGKSPKNINSSNGDLSENKLDRKSLARVPQEKGYYRLYNRDGSLIYVGSAENLKEEIASHRIKDDTHPAWRQKLSAVAEFFTFKKCKSDEDRNNMANSEIERYQPKYNSYNENENMNIQEVKN